MKKTLALILTLCMILALAACGGGSSSGTTVTVPVSGGGASSAAGSSSGGGASAPSGGGSSDAAPSGDEYTPVDIILAHGCTETTAEHASFQLFEQLVEERSGGVVNIDIYPNQ